MNKLAALATLATLVTGCCPHTTNNDLKPSRITADYTHKMCKYEPDEFKVGAEWDLNKEIK